MKQFVYFISTEGGMETDIIDGEFVCANVYGWMTPTVKRLDEQLVAQAATVEVGALLKHRSGVLVRLKDTP